MKIEITAVSGNKGNIKIWNFHSGELLNKIKIINDTFPENKEIYGLCLWNNEYIFVGCNDKNIKLIEINKGKVIKKLTGHENTVSTIKKVVHPKYGQCLISSGNDNKIKIWININLIKN